MGFKCKLSSTMHVQIILLWPMNHICPAQSTYVRLLSLAVFSGSGQGLEMSASCTPGLLLPPHVQLCISVHAHKGLYSVGLKASTGLKLPFLSIC